MPIGTFVDEQCKQLEPIYFSPDFMHRIYINDEKQIVINYTLENIDLIKCDFKSQIMFQKKKSNPMFYFHSNEEIVYLSKAGVEKLFKFVKMPDRNKRFVKCHLEEISSISYNEKQLARRFKMDKYQDLGIGDSLMTKYQLLRMNMDIFKRYLFLRIYVNGTSDDKRLHHQRNFVRDININRNDIFIINDFRKEMSFSFLTWKILSRIKEKDIMIEDFTKSFVKELSVTMLPSHENILHHLDDYEQLQ